MRLTRAHAPSRNRSPDWDSIPATTAKTKGPGPEYVQQGVREIRRLEQAKLVSGVGCEDGEGCLESHARSGINYALEDRAERQRKKR